jgi:tetratricopeptide (TPR) repeat protein
MKEGIAKPSPFSESDSPEDDNNYKKFAGNDQMLVNDPIYGTYLQQVNAKNWVDTLKTAQVIVKKYPKSPGAHNCVGFSSIQLGLDDQAKQSFLSSIELNPDNPAIWNELGNILGRGDQKDLAVSAYEKAIALKPDYTLAWNNFLFLNLSMRNWDKAEKSLRTLYGLDKKLGDRICQDLAKFDFPDQKFTMLVKSIAVKKPEIQPRTAPTQLRVSVAQGDTLTLRNGPGVIYQPVGTIPNGAQVLVTGNSVMNSNTEWIPIQFNSFKGWVVRKYLR